MTITTTVQDNQDIGDAETVPLEAMVLLVSLRVNAGIKEQENKGRKMKTISK